VKRFLASDCQFWIRVATACKELLDEVDGSSLLSLLEKSWKELYPDKKAPGGQVVLTSSVKAIFTMQTNCLTMHVLGSVCSNILPQDISLDLAISILGRSRDGGILLFDRAKLSARIEVRRVAGSLRQEELPLIIELNIKSAEKTVVNKYLVPWQRGKGGATTTAQARRALVSTLL
jgi:hypothetical protein